MSRPMSTSPSQPGLIDPLVDSLLDFSEYDNVYQSPSLSPTTTSKSSFSRPAVKQESSTAASLMPTPRTMSGPSHQYDLYKQQTGLVPGALASTLAVNQNNAQIQGYNNGFGIDYLGLGTTTDDLFDFNTQPSQASLQSAGAGEMDMDFDSPASAVAGSQQGFFFGDASTVNPNSIGGQEPSSMSPASSVGRVWPGMHAQAALAKAQAQQRQQQQMIQQQRQQQQQSRQTPQQQQQQQQRKSVQPTDPIVEQKISQLLNSMRSASGMDDGGHAPMLNIQRPKKDEDDMDDDERLLASEEGKKLSSKERRQLRNKVSARAFRSRRKEYITQLEAEIANKVTENGDLRAENRALVEENKRLTDLTRMLLSSPSFSNFLDRLSTNPQQIPQQQQQQRAQSIAQQPQAQQQQQDARQPPKDVNVYAARQQMQHQQIGMAMIPEQTMDFSMLSLDTGAATTAPDAFSFQPQVYAVLDIQTTAEPAAIIDASVLSGKTSNFVGEQSFEGSSDDKVEMPSMPEVIAVPVEEQKQQEANTPAVVDEEFENDPAFALYHDAPANKIEAAPEKLEALTEHTDIWGGIEPEKALARYELVDAAEGDEAAVSAMAKVQRISAGLETVLSRLELLTIDL